jgi:hypothetical protein
MKAPSQLAQVFIWLGLFCASLGAAKATFDPYPELTGVLILALGTSLGGLLGSFVNRSIAGALIGFVLMSIVILNSNNVRD